MCLSSICSLVYGFSGKVQKVTLLEQTQFSLKVVPKLGTRLIFPFILDDPELKPPLNYKLTNTNDFFVTRNLNTLAGQNVFLITTKGQKGAIGKLYMSIAGYNIAINLIVSNNINDHISDIYLDLTKDDRSFLITKEIDQIKNNLNKNYASRIKQRTSIISDMTISKIMLNGSKKKNIKELYRGSLAESKSDHTTFKSADIYLDKFLYREPDAYALHFWVEHYQEKFSISSILIQLHPPYGGSSLVDGKLLCNEYDKNLDECFYITNVPSIIHNESKLTITLINDKDEIFIINY